MNPQMEWYRKGKKKKSIENGWLIIYLFIYLYLLFSIFKNSPHRFYFDTGKAWVSSSEYEFYVYQTQMGLPSNWSTYYDALASRMSVDIKGNVLKTSRSMCGKQAVADDKDKIVFEKPNSIKADADLN